MQNLIEFILRLCSKDQLKILLFVTIFSAFSFPGINSKANADSPSFECSNVRGEVEKLICSDHDLIALDHKLSETYKIAKSQATGKLKSRLIEDQRSWVSGRNDCWKTSIETWITASWTVKSVRECVEAQYNLRISELQSSWRILQPKTIAYKCQNNPANEVIVNFFETFPETIRLERGDQTVTIWRVGLSKPKLFEGRNVSLVDEESKIKISRLNVNSGVTEQLECKPE